MASQLFVRSEDRGDFWIDKPSNFKALRRVIGEEVWLPHYDVLYTKPGSKELVMLMSDMAYRNALKCGDCTYYVKDADVNLDEFFKKYVSGVHNRPRSKQPEVREDRDRRSPDLQQSSNQYSIQEEPIRPTKVPVRASPPKPEPVKASPPKPEPAEEKPRRRRTYAEESPPKPDPTPVTPNRRRRNLTRNEEDFDSPKRDSPPQNVRKTPEKTTTIRGNVTVTKTETVTEEVIVRTTYIEEEEIPSAKDMVAALREAKAKEAEQAPMSPDEEELEEPVEESTHDYEKYQKTDICKAILNRKKETSSENDAAASAPVLDLETVFTPLLKDSPYIMKMMIDETHSAKDESRSDIVGIEPSTKSEHAIDTEFEYRILDCRKPFASNYLLGFTDGSFSCSEELSEGSNELADLILCIRCDQVQKLGVICCGCGLKFKREFI